MKSILLAAVLLLSGGAGIALADNYLSNADFKDDIQGWHGDGERVCLNADNSEGTDGDPATTPALRIQLSNSHTRSMEQDFDCRDKPHHLTITLEIYTSKDYKHNDSEDSADNWYGRDVEFYVRINPGWYWQTVRLKPGQWTKVKFGCDHTEDEVNRNISFNVTAGTGTIYIRKPQVVGQ